MAEKRRQLYVRLLEGDEAVHAVIASPHNYEKVMAGMLINMNTEKFYIDDSDFDDVEED